MTPKQQAILRHLSNKPDRYAYRVGHSPDSKNIGRWTATSPSPRIWFDERDILALRRAGKLVRAFTTDDALRRPHDHH